MQRGAFTGLTQQSAPKKEIPRSLGVRGESSVAFSGRVRRQLCEEMASADSGNTRSGDQFHSVFLRPERGEGWSSFWPF
jgi:hypothetical protein